MRLHLSPQEAKIIEYLSGGDWKCLATPDFYMKDDRARISALRRKGYVINSMPCDGRCATNHKSRVLMRMLVSKPEIPMKTYYVKDIYGKVEKEIKLPQ